MTHQKFVKSLLNQFRGDFQESRSRRSTSLLDNRLNNKFLIPKVGERKRDCIARLTEKHQAEGANNILLCNVYISTRYPHVGNCFKLCHSVENYKK